VKQLRFALYSVIPLCLLVVTAELLLFIGHSVTKRPELDVFLETERHEPGPCKSHPEECIKIALFGGSSAAGYNAIRGADRIVEHELSKRYPEKKFLVRNFALYRHPFHRYQAELVKANIDKYDFLLILAGHNETANYLDDSGYFRTEAYKDTKFRGLAPLDVYFPGLEFPTSAGRGRGLKYFLESNSRIYAMGKKFHSRYLADRFRRVEYDGSLARRMYNFKRHSLFEPDKAVPPLEMKKVNENFRKDLEQIASLAEDHGKYVIVATVAYWDPLPPFCSVHRAGLSKGELKSFDANWESGLERFEDSQYEEALRLFRAAQEIDEEAAIVDFMMGKSYSELGDEKEARRYFRASHNKDGLQLLGPTFELRNIAQIVAKNSERLYHIDTFDSFHTALDKGVLYDELFADCAHPSLLGHILIAEEFLCVMEKLEPFERFHSDPTCLDLESTDFKALREQYKNELGISDREEAIAAYMSARLHFGMAGFTANNRPWLDEAEKSIDKFLEICNETGEWKVGGKTRVSSREDATALALLYLSLIEANRGDRPGGLNLANRALDASPEFIATGLFQQGFGFAKRWIDELEDVGILYDEDLNSFELGVLP